MKHSLQNIHKLDKLIQANRKAGKEDWYEGFDFEQVSCLYRFAISGYLTQAGAGHFLYADAQSGCKYIRVKLVIKYLAMLRNERGITAATDEYLGLQSRGWFYFSKLNGEDVMCTSEGRTAVDMLNRGEWPENAKRLYKGPRTEKKTVV